jgi:hypothetical protein
MVVLSGLDGSDGFEVVALVSLLVVMISSSREWDAGWSYIYILWSIGAATSWSVHMHFDKSCKVHSGWIRIGTSTFVSPM